MMSVKLIIAGMLLGLVGLVGRAWAGGIVVAPAEVLQHISMQDQLAVVEVRGDHTVSVKLFISLYDDTGKPRRITYLLPLQSKPQKGDFSVCATTLDQFGREVLAPSDAIYYGAQGELKYLQKEMRWRYELGAILGGPGALVIAKPWHTIREMDIESTKLDAAGVNSLEYTTAPPAWQWPRPADKYSRVMYPVIEPYTLYSTATPGSPVFGSEVVRRFADKPFALVQLLLLLPAEKQKITSVDNGPGPVPGLQISFQQRMIAEGDDFVYTYPLATGKDWQQAIGQTHIYVTAVEKLPLQVIAPIYTRMGKGVKEFPEVDMQPSVKGGQQVYAVTIDWAKPAYDIKVRLSQQGERPPAESIEKRKGLLGLAGGGFLTLAAVLWLSMFVLFVRTDALARRIGIANALWRGWLGSTLLCIFIYLVWYLAGYVWGAVRFIVAPAPWQATIGTWVGEGILLLLLAVVLVLLVWLVYRAVHRFIAPELRVLIWKASAAGLVAGVLYAVIGNALVNMYNAGLGG
jgi:hypothetical protein